MPFIVTCLYLSCSHLQLSGLYLYCRYTILSLWPPYSLRYTLSHIHSLTLTHTHSHAHIHAYTLTHTITHTLSVTHTLTHILSPFIHNPSSTSQLAQNICLHIFLDHLHWPCLPTEMSFTSTMLLLSEYPSFFMRFVHLNLPRLVMASPHVVISHTLDTIGVMLAVHCHLIPSQCHHLNPPSQSPISFPVSIPVSITVSIPHLIASPTPLASIPAHSTTMINANIFFQCTTGIVVAATPAGPITTTAGPSSEGEERSNRDARPRAVAGPSAARASSAANQSGREGL